MSGIILRAGPKVTRILSKMDFQDSEGSRGQALHLIDSSLFLCLAPHLPPRMFSIKSDKGMDLQMAAEALLATGRCSP